MSQTLPQNSSPLVVSSLNLFRHPRSWLYAFWKFSRPHTIIGTSLSVGGLYLIALAEQAVPFQLGQLGLIAWALLACLCGNVYIVGLNQLEDVAIDQINKPHLPLASGEFSHRQGQWIVGVTGILALVLAAWQGPFLLAMVLTSLGLGTAYSLPPIRLKRFPFWASFCIFTVRGIVVNLGLFLHFADRLQPGAIIPEIPPAVWALTLFILGFTFAIAIFKDIPDMEGDRRYQIATLTLKLGAETVFNLARGVLTLCYLGMVVAALVPLPGVHSGFLILTQLLALAGVWLWSWRVDLQTPSKAAGRSLTAAQYYQWIWKLFFLEYLLFPIACLLQK